MKIHAARTAERYKCPNLAGFDAIKKAPLQKFRREAIPKTDLSIKNL
jgi:hypothetical protein